LGQTAKPYLQVDYYGAISPLRTIAGISAPDAQSLVIQPYDISAMQNIEKAILKSDLGITPSNDGKIIRINIPALTAVRKNHSFRFLTPCAGVAAAFLVWIFARLLQQRHGQ